MKKTSFFIISFACLFTVSLSNTVNAEDPPLPKSEENLLVTGDNLLNYELTNPFSLIRTSSSDQQKVVDYALQFLGVPYITGGVTPAGFDCSGLVQYVYRNAVGINLPRVTYDQEKMGREVSLNNLQPGDLVFFGSRGSTYHDGIYIGNGKFIHAPTPGDVVKITPMQFYMPDFARRILPDTPIGSPSETITTRMDINRYGKVIKSVERYGNPDNSNQLNPVHGSSMTEFVNTDIEIKTKVTTQSGKNFVLVRQNNKGICWIEESAIEYYPKVGSNTQLNRWGTIKTATQKHSLQENTDYLKPAGGTTSSFIGQDLQIKNRITTTDGEKFVLVLTSNGTGIGWIPESSITMYDEIKTKTVTDSKVKVTSVTPRYSATTTYLKAVSGIDTSSFLNQLMDIKEKIITTDGKVYVLLSKNGAGVCWVEESAIQYFPKIATQTDINLWGRAIVAAQKYALPSGIDYLSPVNGTTNSILGQDVQVKSRIVTKDDRKFVLLLNEAGTGIGWVEESTIEIYPQIQTQTDEKTQATVTKVVSRFSATKNYLKKAIGYDTAGFMKQSFEIKSKIITTDGQIFVLLTKNGSGICWIEESAIKYDPKIATKTDINRWGTVQLAAQKHSLATESDYLTPINATTESILNQEVQIKTKVVTTDGQVFVLLLNSNGTGIAWVSESSIAYYDQIASQEEMNTKAKITKIVPRYSATAMYIKMAKGYDTSAFLNQEVEIKSKIITTDGKTFVLLAKNGTGICWVEEAAVQYPPQIDTKTDINRWGTVKTSAQKHSLAEGSEYLNPINATTESIINQEVQIKTKIVTTDGQVFVLLLNSNGTGIAWVSESSIAYYDQIDTQENLTAKATVIKNVPRYSATTTYLKIAKGYDTSAFLNQEVEIKSKIVTTDAINFVLIAKNGSGICWVEESAIHYIN